MRLTAFSHVSFEYVFLETCFLIDDEKCVNCHGLASIDVYRGKNRVNYDLFGAGKYSVTSFLVKGAGSKIYKISYLRYSCQCNQY